VFGGAAGVRSQFNDRVVSPATCCNHHNACTMRRWTVKSFEVTVAHNPASRGE